MRDVSPHVVLRVSVVPGHRADFFRLCEGRVNVADLKRHGNNGRLEKVRGAP